MALKKVYANWNGKGNGRLTLACDCDVSGKEILDLCTWHFGPIGLEHFWTLIENKR